MKVFRIDRIEQFASSHPTARSALRMWVEWMEQHEYRNHAELKQHFPQADYVGNDRYVFNIGGNKFRLIAIVLFVNGKMEVRFVGTHSEYDKLNKTGKIRTI